MCTTFGGCQRSATAPENRHVSKGDLRFVTGLTNLAEFDHRVIGSALQQNADPRVKSLANELLLRIDNFNQKVRPVAERNGILPPSDMSLFEQSDMHSRVSAIMATSKYDFDQAFLSDEIAGNQEVLSDAEDILKEPVGDPQLRDLVVEAVSRLRDDISRLENLRLELTTASHPSIDR